MKTSQAMLDTVAPPGRRIRLPPQELMLLWQAHQVCADTASEVAQLAASHAQAHPSDQDIGKEGSYAFEVPFSLGEEPLAQGQSTD